MLVNVEQPDPDDDREDGRVNYWDEGEGQYVLCTCPPACGIGCTGKCGCNACHLAYGDYLSMDYD